MPALAAAVLLSARPPTPDAARVRYDFALHCSGCHRLDGTGTAGTIPTLDGIDRFARTEAGRAYLVGVPGVAQAPVSDERLAALLDWLVREHAADPAALPEARPFTASEVARLRARPLRDPAPARAAALSAEAARAAALSAEAARVAAPSDGEPDGDGSRAAPPSKEEKGLDR